MCAGLRQVGTDGGPGESGAYRDRESLGRYLGAVHSGSRSVWRSKGPKASHHLPDLFSLPRLCVYICIHVCTLVEHGAQRWGDYSPPYFRNRVSHGTCSSLI